MKIKLFLFVAMLLPMVANSMPRNVYYTNIDGIYYDFNNSTETATVTCKGYNTEGYGIDLYFSAEYSGSIEIPSEVIYNDVIYRVTSISEMSFSGCSGLTSITIPNSVTFIAGNAFSGCSGLSSVVSEIENPFAIKNSVFEGIPSYATLIVPKGKESIYRSTAGWSEFTNIVEADDRGKCGDNVYYSYDGVTHTLTISGEGGIWGWDFMMDGADYRPWHSYNNEIRSIIIEPGVTSIGRSAFEACGVTSVTIPSSVTTIHDCAFRYCSGLTSVIIPNGVIMIEDDDWGGAFGNCTGLTSIIIPNSVTSIGSNAFRGCSGLTSIQVESGNQKYDSRDNCNAIIETSSNKLISGCKNTIIPNSVTSIGFYAFEGCCGLTSVTIPNKVSSIGDRAFRECSGLTSIVIPNSVTSIGGAAFAGCTGLVYVTLPSNLTSIGASAFGSCTSLTDIYCKAVNVPSASSYAFSNQGDITLHVPNESLNAYQTTEPWNKFGNYKSLFSSDLQALEKCSKPTISIVDGKFVFNCETQFVDYHWNFSTPYGNNGYGGSVPSSIILNVYATKSGYQPSEVATYEFSGLVGDVNNDGEVNVADHVKLSDIILNK